MATIKEIRDRINSVNDTRKITNAMYLISSTKLRKAKKMLTDTEPFFFSTQAMISRVVRHLPQGVENIFLETRLDIPEKERRKGYIIFTDDKGLAGAYNANVIKAALKRVKENSEKGIKTIIYPVGQKAVSALRHKNGDYILKEGYLAIANEPNATGANIIAEDIAESYVSGEIDGIDIITTHFNNMMSYNVIDFRLLHC